MGKVLNLTYTSSLTNLCEVNSSFDTATLRICYTGQNRNGTYISKEALEASIPTLYNCPIVCHYDRDTDSIGGHDMDIVQNANGEYTIVNLTQPVGVIPESTKVWFENVTEDDGSVHEYLCADVLLWKRQEAYQKIKDDGGEAHSMEINVTDGVNENGIYHINSFEFTAFALLGSDVTPCFESSALQFSLSGIKQQMSEMMNEIKETFCLVVPPTDCNNTDNYTGGMTLENGNVNKTDEQKDFELISNIKDEVRHAMEVPKYTSSWGYEYSRYWVTDIDTDKSEVYAWDEQDGLLYGFTYAMNGDNVVVDFESARRVKWAIVDFDEGETPEDIPNPVFALVNACGEAIATAKEDFAAKETECTNVTSERDALNEKYTSLETEANELRKYKLDIENKALNDQKDAVFAQFSDLDEIEAFTELKKSKDSYSVEELTDKCYSMRGRLVTTGKDNFSLSEPEGKVPKLPIEQRDGKKTDEPYGGVFAEYGFTKPNKQ